MTEFLREINWSPLWISLKTGLAATVIAFFLGIFCARKIMKLKPGARAVLDGILTLPLVLPPTVAGFFLLLIFSLKRPFGSFLLDNFVIKAPVAGQLSFVKVTPGQQISSNQGIAEIKVLDQYKIHTSLSEYYIDRITTGLPATINYQGRKYSLRTTKVVPEVKDRTFDVDLVFTGEMPDNVRVGKSFRVQIELGQPEQAIVIPRGNFYQATGGQWIYKLNASKTKAIRVPLSIGRQNPQQYEITDGLQPGDWVITTGYDNFGEAEELILK